MDLSLTPAQMMIKDSARDLLARECPRSFLRQLDDTETGFDPDIWARISDLGWVGQVLPAEYGGGGGSFTDAAVLFEELGYACLPSPLHSSTMLGGLTILEAGSEQQRSQILPTVADGSRILTLAFTEPQYGWSPEWVKMRAVRKGDSYVLNGIKLFVPDAHVANQILVVARTSENGAGPNHGLTVFLVDKGTPGLSTKPLFGHLIDKHWTQVTFDNVELSQSAIVGPADDAWAFLERVLDRAAIVLCAYMIGGMQRMYEMTAEYARNRVHFGQPIAQFQRVQDYIIDALNMADESRWTTYEALWKLDEGLPDASASIALAKSVASDAFRKVSLDAHHVHAGMGGDRSYGLYLYTQKAKAFHSYLGDPSYQRQRLADLMHL